MKKVVSILAVMVFAISMVSCDNDTASNDEFYDSFEVEANDNNGSNSSGGSGGN